MLLWGEAVDVRFRILGPLEVLNGTGWVGIGPPRCRSLLAALLIRRNEVLSVDQLVLELWGDTSPKTAATQVHGYVMRLRRALGDAEGRVLITTSGGYRIERGEHDVDVDLFEAQAEEGRTALRTGRLEKAADALGRALATWRGPALSDVTPTQLVTAESHRLTEQRLATWEACVEVDLKRGRHTTLIAELQRHVAEHPLREQTWRLLMIALYRSGRQAEALQTYQRLRRTIVDEIGVEPSGPLRELHQWLLAGDARLDAEPVVEVSAEPPEVQPVCQLPADVPDFTGRTQQLEAVVGMLSGTRPDRPPPVVVVFGGPGIGKSTLAMHAAHAVSPDFADGQLYLDLAGTSEESREPAVMLAEILRTLGVTGTAIPDGLQARATLYRSLISGRRVLLVLDDAAQADQVRPLIPSTGSSAVLVTSRWLLTDLAGARHIELDVLTPPEAHELFAGIVGRERVAREPAQAEAIVRSCGYLPLAVRIAAGKLVGRPAWSLRVLNERLADQSRRLSELRLGEVGVRASFDLSLRLLPEDAVRAFRLLGLLGPQTVPGWVVGPLLDRRNADDVLDTLVDANLMRPTTTDVTGQARYRLHELLRAYAVEGAQSMPAPERAAGVRRALGGWLHLALSAVERLPPSLFRPPVGPASGWLVHRDTSLVADPLRWFDVERFALHDAVKLAVDWEMDDLAWQLAAAAVPYYDVRSLYGDWQRGHDLALGVVRAAGNRLGEAVLLRGLAQVQVYRDRYDEATAGLARSVELYQQIGDKRGEGLATAGLGTIDRVHGNYRRALDRARTAMDMVTAAGDRHAEAHLRNIIGITLMAQDRDDEARTWFEEALDICRQLGDVHREAAVLREMSPLYDRGGEPGRALSCLRRAAAIFQSLDDERCVAQTLLKAGRLHAAHNDVASSTATLERAAAIFARNGRKMEEAKCWQVLGELHAAEHQVESARQHLARALGLRQAVGVADQTATAGAALRRL